MPSSGRAKYLVQPVAAEDLVVPNPDIGYIIINVTQPHLWERNWLVSVLRRDNLGRAGLTPLAIQSACPTLQQLSTRYGLLEEDIFSFCTHLLGEPG